MTREEAISREAVDTLVDELARAISDERCFMPRGRSTATIMQDILDLPSVRPQEPKWISVSEPERSGEYLVSVIDEYGGNYEAVGIAWFAHKKDYPIVESEWRGLGIDEIVIAWMPLPTPYEPQEGSEKE